MDALADWKEQMAAALADFETVADLGRTPLKPGELCTEYLPSPHRQPSRLPLGTMAVYAFWGDGEWLKVGMAGPNSNARYTSQHYNAGSAPSTLSASLRACDRVGRLPAFDARDPGAWIRSDCCRANVLLPASRPRELLALLEAFLHLRLKPRYEH